MDILEAIEKRHSVRSYLDKKIEDDLFLSISACIDECNKESGLRMQLVMDEPKAFSSVLAHYGKFSGVKNYIAVVGDRSPDMSEKVGYYGEKAVLEFERLGLNTCWVALTYKKVAGAYDVKKGEKLYIVIAFGYGAEKGKAHKSRPLLDVMHSDGDVPSWFMQGMEAVLKAPTAMNQQKFLFSLEKNGVAATTKRGFYSNIDLGIAKYHFEIGAGKENFDWI